jgi:ABC-type sugar transport system substrate-binding protein
MTATIAQNPADIGATGLKLMVDAAKTGKVIPLDKARNSSWWIQFWSRNNRSVPDASPSLHLLEGQGEGNTRLKR